MNIINWIKNQSGKIALSTAQAVGAAAVVGVAGIAAWQMFSSPAVNENTVFSSQDEEVVYVAGGAPGSYNGVGYGEGGELQSHINVGLSSSQRLMNRDAEQEKLRGQNQPSTQLDRDEQAITAYQMAGPSDGLGVGVGAQEMGGGISMGAPQGVQDQLAAISAMAEQKKKEAEAAAAKAGAEGGDVVAAAAKAAGLDKSGKGWGNMNSGIARANGSFSTDEFGGSTAVAGKGGRIGSGTETDRLAMGRSSQLQGPSNANFGGYHGKVGNDLGAMAQYAADAKSKKMAVNQMASDLYMSGAGSSSGIAVNKDSLSLGGASSLDAVDDAYSSLMGASGAFGEGAETYADAKQRIMDRVDKFRDALYGTGALMAIPVIGMIIQGFMAIERDKVLKDINEFNDTWGESVMESENTQGSYGQHAAEAVTEMYKSVWAAGWVPGFSGITAPLAVMQTYNDYRDKYWAEKAEED